MALEFVHIWWVETSQASLALEVIFGICPLEFCAELILGLLSGSKVVRGGCGFRGPPSWRSCSERAGPRCRRRGLAASIPASSCGRRGRQSARPSGNPVASPRVRLEA